MPDIKLYTVLIDISAYYINNVKIKALLTGHSNKVRLAVAEYAGTALFIYNEIVHEVQRNDREDKLRIS